MSSEKPLIQYSVPFFSLVIVFLTLFMTIDTMRMIQSQSMDSTLVNFAGRQRMLNQKALTEVLLEMSGVRTQYVQTLRFLGDNAYALRDGGVIYLQMFTKDQIEILAAPSEEIKNKLDEFRNLLNIFETNASDILSNGSTFQRKIGDPELAKLFSINEKMGQLTNEIVDLYVQSSQSKVKSMIIRSLIIVILLCIFGLWLNKLILEKRRSEIALIKAKEEAIEASKAKSEFLANMSHEIRTPMNAIIGMADLLLHSELSKEQKRYVETFKRSGDTLLALINDLLDLSKLESGQFALDSIEFDLNDLLDRSAELLAIRAHQKNLELICYIQPNTPHFLVGDPNKLKEVIMNLLSNAIKFTAQGEIVMKCELESEIDNLVKIKFAVTDTGIGIPKDKQEAIFESFTQADSSISYNYGGTGLGLTISRRIVEMMGGRIWVTSQVGVGSTFTFNAQFKKSNQEAALHHSAHLLLNKKVLVVDDNEVNRILIRKYLEPYKVHILEATNGGEAIQTLRQMKSEGNNCDILLLDYRMPGMNGDEVMEVIQKEKLTTYTLAMVLTSDGRRTEVGKMTSLGVSEYLIKPIKRNELIDCILLSLNSTHQPIRANTSEPTQAKLSFHKELNILLVEDLEENRFIVQSFLKDLTCKITIALNGLEAANIFRLEHFDIVLMDIRMPVMNGIQATLKIREFEKHSGQKPTPIIALTAQALEEEIIEIRNSGFTDYLSKPLVRQNLIRMINQHTETKLQILDPVAVTVPQGPIPVPNPNTSEPIIVVVDDFLKERAEKYVQSRKEDYLSMKLAFDEKDYEKLRTIAHNVSGTAGVYGFSELSQISHQIEVCVKKSQFDEIEKHLYQFQNYLQRVRWS